MASSGKKTAVLALAIALAAAAAWWGWSEHQRRALRGTVTALVEVASASLVENLRAPRAPAGVPAVRQLDADAQALDARLDALQHVNAARERTLVYAAEEYGLATRAVLRELAQEQRQRRRVAENMKTLTEHMNRANRRAPDWHRNALRLKNDLEKTYFDYKVAADALARELDALADARGRVAERLGRRLADESLIDEALAAGARRRADEAARRVADDMQRARRMAGAR